MFFDARMADVDDVNQKVCFIHFFERCFEGLDQRVRQIAQKSDGIGEQHSLFVRQSETARRRIERSEQTIFRDDIGAGEQV